MGGDGCLRDVSQNTALETEFPLFKRGWNSVGKVKHMQRVPVCYHSTLPGESPGPQVLVRAAKNPFQRGAQWGDSVMQPRGPNSAQLGGSH